jgi:hypothetical protein
MSLRGISCQRKPFASNTMCPSDRWLLLASLSVRIWCGIEGGNGPRAAREMQVIHFLPSVLNALVQSINCPVDLRPLRQRMASRRIQIFHYARTMEFKCVEFLDMPALSVDRDKATKLSQRRRLERHNLRSSIKKRRGQFGRPSMCSTGFLSDMATVTGRL